MIGIIGAMSVEVKSLLAHLEEIEKKSYSGIDYYQGKLFGRPTVIAKCGVGKVFAAVCCQTMILKYQPDIVINTGVAGGLSDDMAIYDLVIAESVIQHDFDISALGDVLGMITGLGRVNIPCAKKLVKSFIQSAEKSGNRYHVGVITSGDQFIADVKKAKTIRNNFKALACEMEGAAIGQTAYINKIPFIVIRSVSDVPDGKTHLQFPFTVKKAAEQSVRLIEIFYKNYLNN